MLNTLKAIPCPSCGEKLTELHWNQTEQVLRLNEQLRFCRSCGNRFIVKIKRSKPAAGEGEEGK